MFNTFLQPPHPTPSPSHITFLSLSQKLYFGNIIARAHIFLHIRAKIKHKATLRVALSMGDKPWIMWTENDIERSKMTRVCARIARQFIVLNLYTKICSFSDHKFGQSKANVDSEIINFVISLFVVCVDNVKAWYQICEGV